MSKQTAAVVAGAIALFIAGVFGALAFTGSDSGSAPTGSVHTMPDGSTMTGQMTEPTHTMSDGETMPGMSHDAP